MTFWFSSDYHLGHENIIEYTKRPFKNLAQMNATLIKNHNSRVKPNDTVFFLGDFCFKNSKGGKEGEGDLHNADHYISKLNGRFTFIRGNHDNNNSLKTILEYAVIHHGGQDIFLCHKPEDVDTAYRLAFCGHVHEKWKFKRIKGCDLINIGCDQWGFKPVELQEIMKEYQKWKKGG